MATKDTALSWFSAFETFANSRDGRMYVQVISAQCKSQSFLQPLHDNKNTRIVVNQ